MPLTVARELGLLPVLSPGNVVKEYVLAGGSVTKPMRIPRALRVSVVEDRVKWS